MLKRTQWLHCHNVARIASKRLLGDQSPELLRVRVFLFSSFPAEPAGSKHRLRGTERDWRAGGGAAMWYFPAIIGPFRTGEVGESGDGQGRGGASTTS